MRRSRVRGRTVSFAVILPVLALSTWTLTVVVPTIVMAFRLHQMAHGSGSVALTFGPFTTVVPSRRFAIFALQTSTLRAEGFITGFITVLNAPAKFVEILVSLVVAKSGNWQPSWITRWAWHSLVYPIYAIPAWLFVGWELDAFFKRRPLGKSSVWIGLVFALLSAFIASALEFGMTASERREQDQTNYFIAGFFLWTLLFAVPVAHWLRDRFLPQLKESQ